MDIENKVHVGLLNTLVQMSESPAYAVRKHTLIEAEQAIVSLDSENKILKDQITALQSERDAAVNELKSLPAKWSEDSSLKTWFPLTNEMYERTLLENESLRAELQLARDEIQILKDPLNVAKQWIDNNPHDLLVVHLESELRKARERIAKSGDATNRKFFVFDPEGNMETIYSTRQEAEQAKDKLFEEYQEYASDYGYHEATNRIIWGEVYQEVETFDTGTQIEFEGEMVDCYGMRWTPGHPPMPAEQDSIALVKAIGFESVADLVEAYKRWLLSPHSIEQVKVSVPDGVKTALERITRWCGEFPPVTDRQGNPSSYGAAYGSNGERDYMRQVAADALALLAAPEAPNGNNGV